MKRGMILLICVCVVGVCLAVDESKEPPQTFTLTINGQAHQIHPDEPLQLQGTFENPKIVLTASPTRKFQYGGVEFDYPAAFTWEAETEGANKRNWTLSGNDFKIMFFVMSAKMTAAQYADGLVKHFGEEKTKVGNTERKLGQSTYKGKHLAVKVVKSNFSYEIFELPAKEGARLLVLMDSLPEGKPHTAEGEKTLEILAATFKDTQATAKTQPAGGK